ANYRSYVCAFADAPLEDALFWDTADPYHYLRVARVNGQRFVVVGGEDHKTGNDEEAHHFDRLIDYARARLKVDAPVLQWSAQVVEPADGLPYIGRNS